MNKKEKAKALSNAINIIVRSDEWGDEMHLNAARAVLNELMSIDTDEN